jgi:hypothetical protein
MLQQRRDILADIMPARAIAEILGALVIMLKRHRGDALQLLRSQCRRRYGHAVF